MRNRKHSLTFGPWEVLGPLGRGGQGSVYRVRHGTDGRTAALKILRKVDPKSIERFRREVEAQRLLGENVAIPVLDHALVDPSTGRSFLVMALAQHGSLWDQRDLNHGNMERTLVLFRRILLLVERAHAEGIVHRDIKPGNILFPVTPNEPRLADFGICYSLGDDGLRITETPEAVGARSFIAPEQELGRNLNVDVRADMFSLGKLLHWLFTGVSLEGTSLAPPTSVTDRRYEELYAFLSQRLVVEDAARRCRSVEELLPEFDELVKRLVGVHFPDARPPKPLPRGPAIEHALRDPESSRRLIPPAVVEKVLAAAFKRHFPHDLSGTYGNPEGGPPFDAEGEAYQQTVETALRTFDALAFDFNRNFRHGRIEIDFKGPRARIYKLPKGRSVACNFFDPPGRPIVAGKEVVAGGGAFEIANGHGGNFALLRESAATAVPRWAGVRVCVSPFFRDYRDELGKHNLSHSTEEPFGFLGAHDFYTEMPFIHTPDHMFIFGVERDFESFLADILVSAFSIPAGRAY